MYIVNVIQKEENRKQDKKNKGWEAKKAKN